MERVRRISAHVAAGELPADDLFGGAGFLDYQGIKTDELNIPAGSTKLSSRAKLQQRIHEFGLDRHVVELDEVGWTVIEDAISPSLLSALRARIMELAQDQLRKPRRSGARFAQIGSLLYHGREFEQACQIERHMALCEYLCGSSFVIWQYLASVRGQGTNGLPVHNDFATGWREPFAPFPEMATSIFVTDEFLEGAGGTFVVPRTHHLSRRPHLNTKEDRSIVARHAKPVLAAPGSIVMLDSRLWHGSLPRRIPGERVVCSYAVCRPHFRSSDDYGDLPEEVLARNSARLARMAGRGLGLMEGGKEGGVLFGTARNAGFLTRVTSEEEEFPQLDPEQRMRSYRLAMEAGRGL